MPETSRRISLSIDVGDPIRGRVAEDPAPPREFEGWLGLLAALGSLLDGPDAGADPSSPSTKPNEGEH